MKKKTYVTFTVSIPDDLKARMKDYPDVDWAGFLRMKFSEAVKWRQ